MNKRLVLMTTLFFGLGLIFVSCAMLQPTPSAENFKAPEVALDSVQLTQYDGYWYFSSKQKPVKGDAGNYGAPLPMSFIFNLTNPNDYPVKLDNMSFTVAFEDFDVNMVRSFETQWIPPGKTNQIAVQSFLTVRQTLLSLLVPNALKVQEKGTDAWTLLEKWWKGIPDYTVPIYVNKGAATFTADSVEKVVSFSAEFPK